MFVLFSANSKRVKALKCLCLRDGAATCDAIFPTEHFQVFHRLFLKIYCKDFVAEPSDCCKLSLLFIHDTTGATTKAGTAYLVARSDRLLKLSARVYLQLHF